MHDDIQLSFSLPAVCRKKVTAAFDGGTISSDGGVLLLAAADKRIGLIDTLARMIPDHRDPSRVTHSLSDILRARVFAIACGYPDADDLDDLRHDPALKLACGRLPDSGNDLASQPTLSRWENQPDPRTLLRLGYGMIDLWCQGYRRAPRAITLDIDDTLDVVHGHQQLSLFNAHYDERCFLPIHVYDADSGHCVATLLRPGKTPDGKEVRGHLRRLIRRIRRHWPDTRITLRGDSHYGRPEAMAWCEAHDVQYLFGLPTNKVLAAQFQAAAEAVRGRRALGNLEGVRDYTETHYAAGTWKRSRRVVARIEATRLGLDIRYVVTNITHCGPEWLYASLYCARGQAENLIKRHKSQLASDRTSCRSPLANQMRLLLHTAAYWLMRAIGAAIPRPQPLANAEFSTLRTRLLKIAVRVVETASRVRLAFAANCPDAVLFRGLLRGLLPRPT
jgi:Transposase DDE domain group 1